MFDIPIISYSVYKFSKEISSPLIYMLLNLYTIIYYMYIYIQY